MNITALVKSQLKDGSDWLKIVAVKSILANMFFFFFSKMLYAGWHSPKSHKVS